MSLSNRTILTYFGSQDNFNFKIVLQDRLACIRSAWKISIRAFELFFWFYCFLIRLKILSSYKTGVKSQLISRFALSLMRIGAREFWERNCFMKIFKSKIVLPIYGYVQMNIDLKQRFQRDVSVTAFCVFNIYNKGIMSENYKKKLKAPIRLINIWFKWPVIFSSFQPISGSHLCAHRINLRMIKD